MSTADLGAAAAAPASSSENSSSAPASTGGSPTSAPSTSIGAGGSSAAAISGGGGEPASGAPSSGGASAGGVQGSAELSAAAAAAGAPPHATPAQQVAFLERARAAGFNFENEDHALSDMIAFRTQLPQLHQSHQQMQQLMPHLSEIRQFLAEKYAPKKVEPGPDPADAYRAPAWSQEDQEEYNRHIQYDDQNIARVSPTMPADLRERARAFASWKKSHEQDSRDPFGYFKKMGFIHKNDMESFVQQQVQAAMQQVQQREQAQVLTQTLERQILSIPGLSENGSLTQLGVAFNKYATQLEQARVPYDQIPNMAHMLARAEVVNGGVQLQSAQEQSRIAAGLPAIAGVPSKVGASQVNPGQPDSPAQVLKREFGGFMGHFGIGAQAG